MVLEEGICPVTGLSLSQCVFEWDFIPTLMEVVRATSAANWKATCNVSHHHHCEWVNEWIN